MIIHGDALAVMQDMADAGEVFDGIITDPPYSSGGVGHKAAISTAVKYTSLKNKSVLPDFDGDEMDMRAWTNWMSEVLAAARKISCAGAVCCVFSNWCMLPSLTDAFQRAGWRWTGIAVWDKTEGSRPQRGRFRQQAEYIVWGSNGKLPLDRDVPILPGVYRYANVMQDKVHQTQKPLALMQDICKFVVPKSRILDPFAGSGTTIIAGQELGYDCVGIESNNDVYQLARNRLGLQHDVSAA